MKVLIDTNILISAALFPQSVPARAYAKAVTPPYSATVCDYSMDEMRRVYNRKFPDRIRSEVVLLFSALIGISALKTDFY